MDHVESFEKLKYLYWHLAIIYQAAKTLFSPERVIAICPHG
jgi:hypothetical protein